MVLVALAVVLSLVAAVASNASAQDTAPSIDAQRNWVRHNVPTAQDWQEASNPNIFLPNPRHCCITLGMSPYATETVTVIGTADTSTTDEWARWFCIGGYYNNNFE